MNTTSSSHYELPDAVRHDAQTLAEDARALWEATAEVTDEKVTQARERLAEALRRGKEGYNKVRQDVLSGVAAGDKMVRDYPYQFVGLCFGLGVVIGVLAMRRG